MHKDMFIHFEQSASVRDRHNPPARDNDNILPTDNFSKLFNYK